uniref:lysozyme n=4 Tax=Meloidogyne TaxID=189290 RepID=A0A914KHA8_MELIC
MTEINYKSPSSTTFFPNKNSFFNAFTFFLSCLSIMRIYNFNNPKNNKIPSITRLLGLFLMLLHTVLPSTANLIFHQIEIGSDCMKAMCLADSGCIQKGCSRDVFDRLGCGYFRMNIWQFKQCYEPGRQIGEDSESAWIRCSEDYECASKCIVQVASRFRLKCYGKSDCETIARLHDGGANGCRTGDTLPYWVTVKSFCPDC